MTNSQRSAALQLGYTQDSWDNAELNVSPPRTASKRAFTRSRRESPERAPVIPTPGSFSDLTGVTPAARGSSGSADVKMPTVSKSSLMASMSGALQAGKKSDQMATLAANKKKNRGPSFHQRMKMMEDDLHEQAGLLPARPPACIRSTTARRPSCQRSRAHAIPPRLARPAGQAPPEAAETAAEKAGREVRRRPAAAAAAAVGRRVGRYHIDVTCRSHCRTRQHHQASCVCPVYNVAVRPVGGCVCRLGPNELK